MIIKSREYNDWKFRIQFKIIGNGQVDRNKHIEPVKYTWIEIVDFNDSFMVLVSRYKRRKSFTRLSRFLAVYTIKTNWQSVLNGVYDVVVDMSLGSSYSHLIYSDRMGELRHMHDIICAHTLRSCETVNRIITHLTTVNYSQLLDTRNILLCTQSHRIILCRLCNCHCLRVALPEIQKTTS